MNISDVENNHRIRLLDLIRRIPSGTPDGWEKTTFAVGGLAYIGFSNVRTEKLIVPIAGEGGGGLRRYSKDGNILVPAAPSWPMEKIIFMPDFISYTQNPEECTIIFEDYAIKAFGFSKCGNYMAVCNSHTLEIFRKM